MEKPSTYSDEEVIIAFLARISKCGIQLKYLVAYFEYGALTKQTLSLSLSYIELEHVSINKKTELNSDYVVQMEDHVIFNNSIKGTSIAFKLIDIINVKIEELKDKFEKTFKQRVLDSNTRDDLFQDSIYDFMIRIRSKYKNTIIHDAC